MGGGVLPYRGLMGRAASQVIWFFGITILSLFVLIRVSILSIFVLKRYLFLDDKQPAHMFYELNYSKIFQTRCFGLNVLNRVSKIGILS